MARTTRSQNLDLVRWLNHGHELTAEKLEHITNSNYLSKMATGEMEITDSKARSIEIAVSLPAGWLDRENLAVIKMSPVDYELFRALAAVPEDAKLGFLKLLSHMRA